MTSCAVLVFGRLLDVSGIGIVAKCIASAGFLAAGLSSGLLNSAAGRTVFCGLLCSATGDVLLLGDSQKFFLLGLASFLLAHALYIGAFLMLGIDKRWSAVAAAPLIAVSVAVSTWISPYVGSGMLTPVRIYTIVITLMVVTAYGVRGATGSLLIPVGATFFYVSDLSVAAEQFVQPDFPNYAWGLPLYYAGQLLIALGAGGLRPTHTMKKGGHSPREGRPYI